MYTCLRTEQMDKNIPSNERDLGSPGMLRSAEWELLTDESWILDP